MCKCSPEKKKHYIRSGCCLEIYHRQSIHLRYITKIFNTLLTSFNKDSSFQIKTDLLPHSSKMRANFKPFVLVFVTFLLLLIITDSRVQSSPIPDESELLRRRSPIPDESELVRRRPCCSNCTSDWCERICIDC